MTIVVAMVSPKARPRARIQAPKIPDRANGRTTILKDSQRVAPKASIDSRSSEGTAWSRSRDRAVTVGTIMMVSIKAAVRSPTP